MQRAGRRLLPVEAVRIADRRGAPRDGGGLQARGRLGRQEHRHRFRLGGQVDQAAPAAPDAEAHEVGAVGTPRRGRQRGEGEAGGDLDLPLELLDRHRRQRGRLYPDRDGYGIGLAGWVGGVEVNTKIVHKSAKQPGAGATLLKHPAQSRRW